MSEDPPNVWADYRKRFRAGPPMQAWSGSQEHIEQLMRDAIERGAPLTPEELWDIQGLEHTTEGAEW